MLFIVWIVYFIFMFILRVCPTIMFYSKKSNLKPSERLRLAMMQEIGGVLVFGDFYPHRNHIEIYLFNCRKDGHSPFKTVIHELRHAWQLKTGFMRFDFEGIITNIEECDEDAEQYVQKWTSRLKLNRKEVKL